MLLLFLSSGLFLGWSLGANDAANIFGSAVGSRMIRFRVAAVICSIGVILGATIGGAGAAKTLGELGAVDAIAGAFTAALAAAIAVYWMTTLSLPISTSQAIVGAIVGWNIFSGHTTDLGHFSKIVATWTLCPILAAIFAIVLYFGFKGYLRVAKLHMLEADSFTRWGLIVIGAFGAYSLGANNVANVVGVFIPAQPFSDIDVFGLFSLSGTTQLLFLGGVAIAFGVITYSKRTMMTVGRTLFKLTPETALVVVLAHSLVLFIFSSQELESLLHALNLPGFPLVPVSSSQAVIGAVVGIGLLKGGRGINYLMLVKIVVGWVVTPLIAGLLAYLGLFVMQNVFDLQVFARAIG